jgi:hypothetical protein
MLAVLIDHGKSVVVGVWVGARLWVKFQSTSSVVLK